MNRQSATLRDESETSYDPGTMKMLEKVVEEAMADLMQRSTALADPCLRDLTRELLAHRVMARAGRGERDPQRLKEHALWGF